MSGDLKTILANELKQLGDELALLAPALTAGDEAAAEQSLTLCERLGQAADMLQMPALHEFAVFLMSNTAEMVNSSSAGSEIAQHQLPRDACKEPPSPFDAPSPPSWGRDGERVFSFSASEDPLPNPPMMLRNPGSGARQGREQELDLQPQAFGECLGELACHKTKSPADACHAVENCLTCDPSQAEWEALRADLTSSDWPAPLAEESAQNLIDALRTLDAVDNAAKSETPPDISTDDLTLTPSLDASPETRRAYFVETPLLASELSSLLANMHADNADETYRAAQRLVHTIKGSSSLLGLHAIAHLAHAFETALQRASESHDAQSDELLSHAADTIEALIEAAAANGAVPDDLLPLIHELHDAKQSSPEQSGPEQNGWEQSIAPAAEAYAKTYAKTYVIAEDYADSHAETTVIPLEVAHAAIAEGQAAANAFYDKMSDTLAGELSDPLGHPLESSLVDSEGNALSDSQVLTTLATSAKTVQPVSATESPKAAESAEPAGTGPSLNVPVTLIDDNLRRTGELNTAIGQLMTHVSETLRRADHLTQQLARVQGQVYELETLVDTRGVPAMQRQTANSTIEGFDPLELDEYTALHSLSRAFAESTLDSRELSRELAEELLKLQNLLSQHARLGRELNDSVTGTRLVPVATIAPRLERIVRQTARQTHRDVELTIHGRELSIDTDILNGLVEPLMHALRNAVDHGIEDADERRKSGKPATGHIRLDFKREGNRIEVSVQDDGRGLDFDAIARRAHERGLLIDGKPISERELTQLIFAPGFSTRNAVTAVSGRGIGMDVVRASIERLKGTIGFDTKRGAGCTLLMRLPLSLTSQHTLFVGVGDCVYGLPSTTVEQVLYSDAGRIVELGDRLGFEYGEQIYPLHSLGALLGHAEANLDELHTTPRPLVLARVDGAASESVIALVVDRALDSRQIVVKGLSPMLPNMPGVAGAAVMPDGGIGVILEVRDLLRTPQHQAPKLEVVPSLRAHESIKHTRRALVVDDSLSARRGLAQLLGDAGYTVNTAVDGLDALAQIESAPPDVILVDMEMPRMNGLELTAHLRGNQSFSGVPIVMITSRATDKHRTQALRTGVNEYITKPYLEHDLIDRLFTIAPP